MKDRNDATIYFVTTNASKFSSYRLYFRHLDINIEQLPEELYEPQSLDTFQIISAKLKQAKEKFPDKKVIVDDRSLFIPALNGFPGPAMKLAITSLGADGFLKLMEDKKSRNVFFTTAIGFFDGENDHFFSEDEHGSLLTKKSGENLRGWSEILYIYAPAATPDRPLAEYSDEEWEHHHTIVQTTQNLQKQIAKTIRIRPQPLPLQPKRTRIEE